MLTLHFHYMLPVKSLNKKKYFFERYINVFHCSGTTSDNWLVLYRRWCILEVCLPLWDYRAFIPKQPLTQSNCNLSNISKQSWM